MTLYSYHVFKIAAVMFSIGLFGMLARRNAISMLLSLELMINAGAILLVGAGAFSAPRVDGPAAAAFVIVIAAAEAATAIAIFIALFKGRRTIDVDEASEMKG